MMEGCHPLSEHRNAVGGVAVQRFRASGSELEKRSLRRRGSRSLNWTFTHERLRMFHQQRRRGTLISAIFSISDLVLDHALSPAFDVAKDVPPRKVRAARTKVIKMIVAPAWQRAHRRARQSAGAHRLAGALPHSELVARDVGKAAADRRVLRIRDESDEEARK
jgi:hypothetical protein